jgi:polyhydroxybutyrate depolymerase
MRFEIAGRPTLVSAAPRRSAPAVVFLHGTGGAIDWIESEVGLLAWGRSLGVTVAYPQGLPPDPAKAPGFLSNPYRWNDGSTRPGDPLHSTTDDVNVLDGLFDRLVTDFHADPARLYLIGFSNGAAMTFRFTAEGRTPLAGIAPIAGHCWVTPRLQTRPLRTIALLGDRDPLIPVAGGTVVLPWGQRVVERPPIRHSWGKWAIANGGDPHPIESTDGVCRTLQYPQPYGEFTAMIVPGLGHHWPGGAGQLNPRLGGPKESPIRANDVLAAFFDLGHTLAG